MPDHGPIRTVIVDDEPIARRGIRLMLARDPDFTIVGEAASGPEAVAAILGLKPALVFLDIQIPAPDGFGVLEQVAGQHLPRVIFSTAYDRFAIQAFEINAVDYLLKPYDDERFAAALRRVKDELARPATAGLAEKISRLLAYLEKGGALPEPADGLGPDRLLVKSGGEVVFLKPDEIDWIEADGDYMKFHVAGRTLLLRATMNHLVARLPAAQFARIHRSTIVNLRRVRKIVPVFAGEYSVILEDGTKLRLSRGYLGRVRELLRQTL